MSSRDTYSPGPATVGAIDKDGDKWTLALTREFRHSPDKVWQAITDPNQLREWAPFESDKNLGTQGATARLITIGAPAEHGASDTTVTKAEAPHLLEFKWGQFDTRWQLEAVGEGTRLKLWINIPRPYIAMGAAGWQVCFDVLDHLLEGDPIGRLTGPDALHNQGWQRLYKEYSEKFGIEMPSWTANG